MKGLTAPTLATRQAIPKLWRLQTLSRHQVLPDEAVYRARSPAAHASHDATEAILSALEVSLGLFALPTRRALRLLVAIPDKVVATCAWLPGRTSRSEACPTRGATSARRATRGTRRYPP